MLWMDAACAMLLAMQQPKAITASVFVMCFMFPPCLCFWICHLSDWNASLGLQARPWRWYAICVPVDAAICCRLIKTMACAVDAEMQARQV
jgi:hypothetical protein